MASGNPGKKRVAIVGTGPAALMAAEAASLAGQPITLFEKRKGPGRKLLIAGSSGLNIGNSLPVDEFIQHYTGGERFWEPILRAFPPSAWLAFIERLGLKTFEGTSHRYFVDAVESSVPMKGSKLLHAWLRKLDLQGVETRYGSECTGFENLADGDVRLSFNAGEKETFSAVVFALGGGSWEPEEMPLRWPALFQAHGVGFTEFQSSNCGYRVAWPEALLKEAEGLPIKTFRLTTARGTRKGEAVITKYGMEGTPVYSVGQTGPALLDLKPDLVFEAILERVSNARENLSPIRRIKKHLGLSPASLALLFHLTPKETLTNLSVLCRRVKELPIEFLGPQPLTEAISSSGGIHLDELTPALMLKRAAGIFVAGEMLDWDAPTGGFLIQAAVSQGFVAGQGVVAYLETRR